MRASSIWITWPIVFSSLIGCSFILEEAVKPESAKDSLRYPIPQAYVLRAKIEAVIAIIAMDLRATRCSLRAGAPWHAAITSAGNRDRRHLRQRDPALVPHPGQAQPIPPPPSVHARRQVRRRGFFVDRLGRYRRRRFRRS